MENAFRDLKFIIFSGIRENAGPFNIGMITPGPEKKMFSETYILRNDTSEKWGLNSLFHENFEVFTITLKIRKYMKKMKNLH